MNTLFLAAQAGGAAGGNMMMILMIIVLGAVTYFGMIRPQKKQQQRRMQMMDQLKKGDQVVLVDGLHAKIDSINSKDKTVVVDADGIYLTFSRMAVRQIIPSSSAAAAPAKPAEDKQATNAPAVKENKPAAEDNKKEDSTDDSAAK